MLKEEIEQYTKLTGEDGQHVPIIKIGAYLDGYNKGLEILDKIRTEIINLTNGDIPEHIWNTDVLDIINRYKVESEE